MFAISVLQDIQKGNPFRRFNMSYYLHDVPGRLRIRTPLIKKKHDMVDDVHSVLRPVYGISGISVNPVTGSIVVNYDPKIINSRAIVEKMSMAGYFDHSKAVTMDQYIKDAVSKTGHFVKRTLLGTAVETLLAGHPIAWLAILI